MIYGRLATACGYTPDEIDALTLPQVLDLYSYWKQHPPMHELLAMQLGYKPNVSADEAGVSDETMAAMLDASGGKMMRNLRNG